VNTGFIAAAACEYLPQKNEHAYTIIVPILLEQVTIV